MRQRDVEDRPRDHSRDKWPSGLPRAVKGTLIALVTVGVLSIGLTAPQLDDHSEGAASARVPDLASSEELPVTALEPTTIPVVEVPVESEGASGGRADEPRAGAGPSVDVEQDAEPAPGSPSQEPDGAVPPSSAMAVEDIPEGDPTVLVAGSDARTVATVSGTGSIRLGFTRASSSSAPNLPTYVSAVCDGASVYSGAFNTTTQGAVAQDVPFSGSHCAIQVKIAQPSAKWAGTTSSVVVTQDQHETQSGTSYVETAEWTSTAVSESDDFEIDVPQGFTGTVSIKLTACSSQGGTSDDTKEFACGDLVQKGVGSEGTITVSDGEHVLVETGFDITAETHHDMVTVDVSEPVSDDLTLDVERTGGSAVVVHGPGTSAVGTH